MTDLPITTRKEAQAQGLIRYFTGKPCKNGHIAERITSNGTCLQCACGHTQKTYAAHQDEYQAKARDRAKVRIESGEHAAYQAQWRAENRERHEASRAAWSAENADRIKGHRRASYMKNTAKEKHEATLRQRNLREQYDALDPQDQARIDSIYAEGHELNKRDGANTWHIDHIIPLAKGGAHHPDNLQILPAKENLSKGARMAA